MSIAGDNGEFFFRYLQNINCDVDSYFVIDSNNNIIEEFDTQREAEEFVDFKARWGHDYSYTDQGDGTHLGTCSRCDKSLTAAHSFTNGTCVCGAKEAVLDENIKIYHTLDLASDISINYLVPVADLADYDSFYLEVRIPGREEALRIDPIDKGIYYYFTLEGLTAVQMGDRITATLYMEKDGRTYYWEPDTYSIAQYAYAQLNKAGVDPKLKALCADLLRYGSKAQIFKAYRTVEKIVFKVVVINLFKHAKW